MLGKKQTQLYALGDDCMLLPARLNSRVRVSWGICASTPMLFAGGCCDPLGGSPAKVLAAGWSGHYGLPAHGRRRRLPIMMAPHPLVSRFRESDTHSRHAQTLSDAPREHPRRGRGAATRTPPVITHITSLHSLLSLDAPLRGLWP